MICPSCARPLVVGAAGDCLACGALEPPAPTGLGVVPRRCPRPQVIEPGETFSVTVRTPPIPCARCRVDLVGTTAVVALGAGAGRTYCPRCARVEERLRRSVP